MPQVLQAERQPLASFCSSVFLAAPNLSSCRDIHIATVAMFASKVVSVFSMMLLMGLKVQGVPVSFGNVLSPRSELTVHCVKDAEDVGTRTISPWKEYSVFLPTGFYGTYVCDFAAPGKRTTRFDVINSRCNCNSFYGCAWVVKSDGFYCNFDIVYRWA